jgi:hypothetical protein
VAKVRKREGWKEMNGEAMVWKQAIEDQDLYD